MGAIACVSFLCISALAHRLLAITLNLWVLLTSCSSLFFIFWFKCLAPLVLFCTRPLIVVRLLSFICVLQVPSNGVRLYFGTLLYVILGRGVDIPCYDVPSVCDLATSWTIQSIVYSWPRFVLLEALFAFFPILSGYTSCAVQKVAEAIFCWASPGFKSKYVVEWSSGPLWILGLVLSLWALCGHVFVIVVWLVHGQSILC